MDRILRPLWRVVRQWVDERLGYPGFYPATVMSSTGGDSVSIQPVDQATWGAGFTCPVVYGVPGISASWPQGTRIYFGFLAGDPTQPFVPFSSAINQSGVVLTFVNGQQADGAAPVARVGDTVPLSAADIVSLNLTAGGYPLVAETPTQIDLNISSGNPQVLA